MSPLPSFVGYRLIEGVRMSTGEVDDLWASFNEPDPQPSASASTTTVVKGVKKIKIQVAYEFVGETVL